MGCGRAGECLSGARTHTQQKGVGCCGCLAGEVAEKGTEKKRYPVRWNCQREGDRRDTRTRVRRLKLNWFDKFNATFNFAVYWIRGCTCWCFFVCYPFHTVFSPSLAHSSSYSLTLIDNNMNFLCFLFQEEVSKPPTQYEQQGSKMRTHVTNGETSRNGVRISIQKRMRVSICRMDDGLNVVSFDFKLF